jgi:uracil-DNA glycosylase
MPWWFTETKGMPTTELMVAAGLLLQQVRACALCAFHLPLGVRPVLQAHRAARILVVVVVVGQAPRRTDAIGE